MKKMLSILFWGLLLSVTNAYANDVVIDVDGNVTTGTESYGKLYVTGASAESAIIGFTSGTAVSVYGENTTYGTWAYLTNEETGVAGYGNLSGQGVYGQHQGTGNAGSLGSENYGVYGIHSTSGNWGYLGTSGSGVFGNSPSGYGVYGESSSGYAGYFEGNAHVTGNLTVDGSIGYTETDPVYGASAASGITSGKITNWDAAFGWGDHSSAGYLTTETDPVYGASAASGITSGKITNWDAAFGWGDHSSAGYDSSNDSWTGTGNVYMTSGNVGIGTSSPSSKLTVEGGGIEAYDSSGQGMTFTTYSFSVANSNEDPMMFIGDTPTDTIEFSNSGYTVMKIINGNVGIGTTNPLETLSVAGTIESTSGGIKFPNGTVQTTAIAADQQCAEGESVTGFDQNGNIICSSAVGITYAIGDYGPAGGIVFYAYAGGLHGMEAALSDQSSGAEWGCAGIWIDGADGIGPGTGAQNTADILAGCSESGIAAEIADNYSQNGYEDWFLPSKDEINLLYQQKDVVGGFADEYYWSSTEFDGFDGWAAWRQSFLSGSQAEDTKYTTLRVRAVRAF